MTQFKYWRFIRLALVAFSFISSLFVDPENMKMSQMTWLDVGIVMLSFPIIMLIGVSVLLVVKGRKFDWQPPAWYVNPFNFSHPEHFFHLGAFIMLASGFATLIRALMTSSNLDPGIMVQIAMGIGLWFGLRMLTAIYWKQSRNDI